MAVQGTSAPITFAIDTGAERTHLSAADARKLGVDLRQLPFGRVQGVGGLARVYQMRATLMFVDEGRFFYAFDVPVNVFPDTPEYADLPSLLGRDVLNRMEMVYSPPRRGLQIEIVAPDVQIAL